MKVMVGVNTLESVEQPVYSNHCQMWFHLGKRFPDWQFMLHNPRRMSIDRMRNATAKLALEAEADYLLFIDDDIVVEPVKDFLDLMIKDDKDIVAGWTIIRGWPFNNMLFKFRDEKKEHLDFYNDLPMNIEEPLVKCDAVGFSICLIKCSLLKKLTPPYFVTGPYNTEDIYFCMKAMDQVPDVQIYADLRVITHHALGTEYISPLNRDQYKKYMLATVPEFCGQEGKAIDRGDEYLEAIR